MFKDESHRAAKKLPYIIVALVMALQCKAETGNRPFIWVRAEEREAILKKINTQKWAKDFFNGLEERANRYVKEHQADRDGYLRSLPIQWQLEDPVFHTTRDTSERNIHRKLEEKLNGALDCAVLFYLTEEEKYASYAADLLHNAVEGYSGLTPSSSSGNGGWIYHNDYLKEARVFGCQLPVVYDFLFNHLTSGHTVYDVKTKAMVPFNFDAAQQVFRTYYKLARDHGHAGSNWSVLMSTSMMLGVLALDDIDERNEALPYVLHKDTKKQDSLKTVAKAYKHEGDIWPESFQYSEGVNTRSTYTMTLLERYDPTLKLYETYPNVPLSISRISTYAFPNGDQMRFGDGHRHGGSPPYFYYEMVYQHALAKGNRQLQTHFGSRINEGISSGTYDRSRLSSYSQHSPHNVPLQLLWFADEVKENASEVYIPRTDTLPFAGIALQRNLAPNKNPFNGLMGWIGGAHYVHGHASGMNMELYGLGHVLGADSGRTKYQTAIHENYYRLYAAHNTIIVNGASRGQGGWQGLGINTVKLEAMEPAPRHPAVSPEISFSSSSFVDDKGNQTEAVQLRTLALVRTAATSGYYVDIFRSRSSLPEQFHDYIYHNIGDDLQLAGLKGTLRLSNEPDRFQNDIGGKDYGQECFQQPGWRYFKNTKASRSYSGSVRALFSAKLKQGDTCMQLFIPGMRNREYATVVAPAITEAPKPYNKKASPAIVIRQKGDAWNHPFAIVFEPHLGKQSATVQAVEHLSHKGAHTGLKVTSKIADVTMEQYILALDSADGLYADKRLKLAFQGRFATLTIKSNGAGSIYIGEGRKLVYKGLQIDAKGSAVWLEFSENEKPRCTANGPVIITMPNGNRYELNTCTDHVLE